MKNGEPILPEWIEGRGPDADVVISTRARLARSLSAYPFPSRASVEDLAMVAREVRAASTGLTTRFPKLKAVSVDRLSAEERNFLLDARVASVEQVQAGEGRIIVLEPSATLSIMVNEEDHLRLQAVLSGLAPRDAWELVDWADDVLEKGLDYGYSPGYGYLTASVSNVGTGLRVSALMHLAGLALTRQLNAKLRAALDVGVSIRGVFGEGTVSVGDLFQVSNETTLGLSESEIVDKVRAVAGYLLSEERAARKELRGSECNRLIERASRALNVLQSAMSIRAEQAVALMSPVRLASAMELTQECPLALLNELMLGIRVGVPQEGATDIERAGAFRHRLAGARISSC